MSNSAYVDGSLIIETELDASGFNRDIKNLNKSMKTLEKQTKGLGVALKGFLGAQVVKTLTAFATQAIELASDLDEVQNVVDTAFGSMAYKAEEFADVAIEQFGMSKLSAKQTASTFMAMGKSMGLSMEAASDMAIDVAKLTGDVASFYNLSQDVASTKLKSIWTGETETLKDLGVVMTEVNLEQFAMQQGMGKSYSAMSQAEKISLRYAYVTNALADAQGDFAKTSDSWANQTRILSERWKELLSILGGGLITVLTPVLQFINKIMAALISLANAFSKVLSKVFGFSKKVQVSASAGAAAAESQGDLADATTAAGKAANNSTASFDKLNVLQQDTASSSGSGAAAGGGGVGITEETVKPAEENNTVFDKLSDKLKRLKSKADALKVSWGNLKTTLENFANSEGVKSVAGLLKEIAESMMLYSAEGGLTSLAGAIDTMAGEFKLWQGIFDTIVALCEEDLPKAAEGAETTASGFVDTVAGGKQTLDGLPIWFKQTFDNILKPFEGFVDAAWVLINVDWKGMWTDFKTDMSDMWTQVKTNTAAKWKATTKAVKDGWTAMTTTLSAKWTDFKTDMSTMWTDVKTNTVTKWKELKKGVKDVWKSLTTYLSTKATAFKTSWLTVWGGLKTEFKNIWDGMATIAENAINKVIDAINWCIKQLNKVSIDVPDWVEKLTGMSTFGFNIPTLSHISVPKLATGAVIPPNGEFLAMLGDQKHGNNIEAPESLIRQIVREESGGGDVIINANGKIGQIIRLLRLEIAKEDKRKGGTLIKGGVY